MLEPPRTENFNDFKLEFSGLLFLDKSRIFIRPCISQRFELNALPQECMWELRILAQIQAFIYMQGVMGNDASWENHLLEDHGKNGKITEKKLLRKNSLWFYKEIENSYCVLRFLIWETSRVYNTSYESHIGRVAGGSGWAPSSYLILCLMTLSPCLPILLL